MRSTSSILWSVKLFINPMSPQFKVTFYATSFVSCGSPFANQTLISYLALRVGKPIHRELWAYEQVRCPYVDQTWDIISIDLGLEVLKTWLWLKAISLGHKPTFSHLISGTNVICFDTHLVVEARRLKVVKPLILHVTCFDSDIVWFSSLVATFAGSCTFHLSIVLVWMPKPFAFIASRYILIHAVLLWRAARLLFGFHQLQFTPQSWWSPLHPQETLGIWTRRPQRIFVSQPKKYIP